MKLRRFWAVFLAATVFFVGCTSTEKPVEEVTEGQVVSDQQPVFQGTLRIVLPGTQQSIDFNDIFALPSVTREMTFTTSEGETLTQTMEGVLLGDLIAGSAPMKSEWPEIRFVAGDGYAAVVPQDVTSQKEILLVWRIDGELLDAKSQPLRVAINNERSMYYVANLTEIVFIESEENVSEVSANALVFLETALASLETETFGEYKAVSVADLMSPYVTDAPDYVRIAAVDDFEKTEAYKIFTDNKLVIEGDEAPFFTGEALQPGMQIKYVMLIEAADQALVSVARAQERLGTTVIGGTEGALLIDLLDLAGIMAPQYTLTADDGYSFSVPGRALKSAVVSVDESGKASVTFSEDYPKKYNINGLIMVNGVDEEVVQENEEPTTSAVAIEGWTITFEGLSDGSFDMTLDKAQQHLEGVSMTTEREKNDVTYPEAWEGYRLVDLLSFLRVDAYDSLTIVASDGYQTQLTKDMVDDTTILAHVMNGDAMAGTDNPVQLVQDTRFATTWVKGVVKIIVE